MMKMTEDYFIAFLEFFKKTKYLGMATGKAYEIHMNLNFEQFMINLNNGLPNESSYIRASPASIKKEHLKKVAAHKSNFLMIIVYNFLIANGI